MKSAISMVRRLRDRRGINPAQENYLLECENNWQVWIQKTSIG